MVHVPSLLGSSQTPAEDFLHAIGLATVVVRKRSAIGRGVVIELNPHAGELIPRGSIVTLSLAAD